MSIDLQLSQAIYDLIFDSLTMAPPGAQPATSAASTMLSLSVPGLPLDPAEFVNPWTPMNPGGNPVTAENFAWLVDAIPQVSSVFVPNGHSIETLYGQIVQANTPAAAPAPSGSPLSPALTVIHSPSPGHPLGIAHRPVVAAVRDDDPVTFRRRALDLLSPKLRSAFGRLYTEGTVATPQGKSIKTFVETPVFRKYLDRRAARDEAVTRYMSQLLQVNMNDPAEKQRWATAAAVLETQVKSATKAVEEAAASEVEAAMAAVASGEGDAQNSSVAAIFSAARLNFELSKLGSMLGPGYTWHMTLAQPQSWFAPETPFCAVDLRTSQQLRTSSASRFAQFGGQAALGSGLWGGHAQNQRFRRSVTQQSVDIRVRFKFARVSIRRPWLDTSLFSLAGWSMAGRQRNELSTGSLTGNTGIFPLLPSSIIIARDLQISAAWSQTDVILIRDRLEKRDLSFGPFALSGQYERPHGKIANVTSATFDGVNISAPGLQVVGWLSNLVPACPPLGG